MSSIQNSLGTGRQNSRYLQTLTFPRTSTNSGGIGNVNSFDPRKFTGIIVAETVGEVGSNEIYKRRHWRVCDYKFYSLGLRTSVIFPLRKNKKKILFKQK